MENINLDYVNSFLTQYLLSLGFVPKHSGFTFIKQCVQEGVKNNGVLGSLSKQVYPAVAKLNNSNAINVERNIRNSINYAKRGWKNCNDVDNVFFRLGNVSNRNFLAFLVDQVIIAQMQMVQVV